MSQIDKQIIATLLGGFLATVGGVVVALLSDWLVRRREHRSAIDGRKRTFIAFLASWKHEIGRLYLTEAGFEHHQSAFSDVVSDFIIQSELIAPDFPPPKKAEFDSLCAEVIGWKHQNIYNKDENEKVQKAIANLIAFVEKSIF